MDLDTGYTEEFCQRELSNGCRGGCEHTIDKDYKIMKNPMFALEMEKILKEHTIDHVIIPIRDLEASARSREENNRNHGGYGGFWLGSKTLEEQKINNAKLIYNLIETLTNHDIPYTTIAFPRMIGDKRYLAKKLDNIDGLITCFFNEAFDRVADPEKITV